MKILVVAGKLTYSNAARYTLALVQGLKQRGHEVQVAALGGPLFDRLAELGVEAYHARANFFSRRRLVQFLMDFDPDLVHATGGPAALQTGARLARAIGAPLIHTVHSWLPEDRAEQHPRHLRGIIAVNESLREHLVNEGDVPKHRIKVIPYGVHAESTEAPVTASAEGRIPVVGTIGRLERGRRHDEFVRAAARVRAKVRDVHFMIAGEGPDEDVLRRLVKELDCEETITFVQPQTTSVDIYDVLDILVIVSDWGGAGFNLLEGMARGRPVIATGGGEVYSLLGEEGVCVIVPAGDTERLAEAIVELLADPERRRQLGENAWRYVVGHYPLHEQVVRVESYYSEVMAGSTA